MHKTGSRTFQNKQLMNMHEICQIWPIFSQWEFISKMVAQVRSSWGPWWYAIVVSRVQRYCSFVGRLKSWYNWTLLAINIYEAARFLWRRNMTVYSWVRNLWPFVTVTCDGGDAFRCSSYSGNVCIYAHGVCDLNLFECPLKEDELNCSKYYINAIGIIYVENVTRSWMKIKQKCQTSWLYDINLLSAFLYHIIYRCKRQRHEKTCESNFCSNSVTEIIVSVFWNRISQGANIDLFWYYML